MNRTIELPVRGMDCASCASMVRGALESVEGVVSVDVRLTAEKAVVEYDDVRADRSRLARAVVSAGYAVSGDAAGDGVGADRGSDERSADRVAAAEQFSRRALGVTGVVFGGILAVVVLGEWLGLFEAVTRDVPFAAGVVVVLLVGWPAFRNVVRAAVRGRVISHTLMTVGVLAALVIGQWVTAAVVAFFMRVGDFVEGFTMRRGRRALRELEGLAPTTARVVREGTQREMPLAAVRSGDRVVVRPGERIPVDGRVVDGRAAVEQAAITGESMPVEVAPGDRVFAATIARGGALEISVTRVGEEATFGRILRMVEDAEAHRGSVESFADRFSGWYLPVVGAVALLTFVLRGDALATAAVLVVACSCAFAIATPVAMMATIGAAARRGLLVKGGAYVEALARADVVLVDKTGTFTTGRPAVVEVRARGSTTEAEILALAAAAERDSEHPLAEAIRVEAVARGVRTPSPSSFRALEGIGIEAVVEGRTVRVGSRRLVEGAEEEAVRFGRGGVGAVRARSDDALTRAHVMVDGSVVGSVGFRDPVRDDVPAAVAALREMGLETIEILTGDHEGAAAPVARRLGVGHRAGLLPEDKIRIVRDYQERGHTVVMIGDGVNDAPALAQADVGIAMGAAGTDLALEVAHVALLRDDWTLVPEAFRIARRTMGVVKGNFGLTAAYNVIGLSLAAVGILPPILAAAAQSLPDLGILGNSARLLRS